MSFEILLLIAVPTLAVASLFLEKSISALLSFSGMMFLLGIYYISREMELLGLLQIFVYTGGIVVLMLFALSLFGEKVSISKPNPFAILFSALFTLVVTLYLLRNLPKSGGELSETAFSGEILPIFSLIVVSIIYGSIKVIRVSKESR